ncbi:MAG: inorganic phosphate transporter [Burkholderiales bacterium]|nr:inorganic phosphate transporter [Burkholderiales bacterium]
MEGLLLAAALFVALSNGANDNFKGFATVWGSGTLNYRQALTLATLATIAGSLASWLLADTLVQQFSGKGLVPDAVANGSLFIMSVASAAAATVFLATHLGFPVSTTHALIGGLIGAGFAQSGGAVHLDQLAQAFLLPLLISPLLAALLGVLAYRLFRLHPVEHDCACVLAPAQVLTADGILVSRVAMPSVVLASDSACASLDAPLRVSVSRSMDRLHVWSAMAICFARSVNDTPKLAALLIAAHLLQPSMSVAMIACAMALGGIIFARQVAQTMSQGVTRMNPVQGLAANLITASLVLFASKLGMPVSTTHVAVGSIAGVGASAKTLNWLALRNILLSWIATLPLASGVAWSVARLLHVLD